MKVCQLALATALLVANAAGSALESDAASLRNLKGKGNDGCPVGKTVVFYSPDLAFIETYTVYPAATPSVGDKRCKDDGVFPGGTDVPVCTGDTTLVGPVPLYLDADLTGEPVGNRYQVGYVVDANDSEVALEASGTLVFDDDVKSEIKFTGYVTAPSDGENVLNDIPVTGGTGAYEGASGRWKLNLDDKFEIQTLTLCLD